MSYTTLTFLFFLLATGILYFALPKKLQWPVLLAASLGFFALWCGKLIWMPAVAAFVIYAAALYIQRTDRNFRELLKGAEPSEKKSLKKKRDRRKKAAAAGAVIMLLAGLVAAKYMGFFGDVVNSLAAFFGKGHPIPVFHILMPLGISYYTLMAISYVADVYRGTVKAEKNPFMLMLFLCYFPHIVEGPFDRYEPLCRQFREPHYLDYEKIRDGGIRFVWGLFKKFVIADRAALIAAPVFAEPDSFGGTALLAGGIFFTLQIYADFSGCMDMVRGVSHMLGIEIAENFRRPFFAVSIEDFWRRWHITLGHWLRDYVFYSVSLSKHFRKVSEKTAKYISSQRVKELLPAAYALFFVWLCNGLWHGAGWKYIFYGLYYYILMMAGRAAAPAFDAAAAALKVDREGRGFHIFRVFRTCLIVCFGMIIFRSETLSKAWDMTAGIAAGLFSAPFPEGTDMFTGFGAEDMVVLLAASAILLTVSVMEERGREPLKLLTGRPVFIRWPLYMCLLFSVIILGVYGGNHTSMAFIYAEF
ncbi:MAG TPA: MBOAT family protein [Candidatus Copromorpha excrementigallinarum]|uniref:MBOAT family protein n=1 Tax=Candidatus Allocopromorpha excrementigallinarum TaxID=2840742 RepID=A0A9D1I3B1_9FIRM|nr:MBOAT family protein [Candidatus Copromorpha excrementigallinarum]